MRSLDEVFAGADRFELERELGRGGMGVVFAAFDRERGLRVALKMLRKAGGAAIFRIKREFRALADVTHPNLVELFELFAHGSQWYFTMELVDGVDFLTYVRGDQIAVAGDELSPTLSIVGNLDTDATTTTNVSPGPAARRAAAPANYDRLRSGMIQLAEGLNALHRAGHLHRDVKPSNIMVTPEGRIVLMDLGVTREILVPSWQTDLEEMVGTPAYMAPEQVTGASSEASDWYAVGVVLYQALTGRRPFEGSASTLLSLKQQLEPVAPRAQRHDVPADLNDLCVDLLRLSPAQRPTGREVLARLGAEPGRRSSRDLARHRPGLVGRDAELAELHDILRNARRGEGVTVNVRAASGMGKSALVEAFLETVAGDPDTVILSSRCYERETVPFKAVDGILDALSQYLMPLPRHEVDAVLPRDILLLARMFPVLRRVEAVVTAKRRSVAAPDPHELRRRAAVALRELLGMLAEQHPTVVAIDDAQWGDADSAVILDALMRPPDVPPLMLIVVHRSEVADRGPLLRALERRQARLGSAVRTRDIELESLSVADGWILAKRLLGNRGAAGTAHAIASESDGNPYFIHELARYARRHHEAVTAEGGLRLEQAVMHRIGELPGNAQRVLDCVAVAVHPISERVVASAARIHEADVPGVMHKLRVAQLVKSSGTRGNERVEPIHDRIRETVRESLSDGQLRRIHYDLAMALERLGHGDAEDLATHFLGAGELETASRYAVTAADRATEALAFDRAAQLYRMALDLSHLDVAGRRTLQIKLADALVNAGHGAEAAPLFVEAAGAADIDTALELRRRAAFEYLQTGGMEQGVAELHGVLRSVGLKLRAPRRSLLSLVWGRIVTRLRGTNYKTRDVRDMRADDLRRIDVCWSVAASFGFIDPIRGADFHTRHLRLLARAPDPFRLARGLVTEAAYLAAFVGERAQSRVHALIDRALELADPFDDPFLRGWVEGCAGVAHYQAGEFQESLQRSDRAIQLLRDHCTGASWYISTSETCRLWSLFYRGEMRELSHSVVRLLDDGHQRGDLYTLANLHLGLPNVVWLVADDPDEAARRVAFATEHWAHATFDLQQYWALFARAQRSLYVGEPEQAYQLALEGVRGLKGSMLWKIRPIRIELLHLRGLAAAASAFGARNPDPLLRAADRDARRLEKEGVRWAHRLGMLVRASSALARGRADEGRAVLESAAPVLEDNGMALHAAMARRALGELTGGGQGATLVHGADDWMARQGIRSPQALSRIFLATPSRSGAARR